MPLDTSKNEDTKILNQKFIEDYLQSNPTTSPSTSSSRFYGSDLGLDNLDNYKDYVDIDNRNLILNNPEVERALNQSNLEQFAYGTLGGLSKGLLSAVENTSYLLDFDAHLKQAQGLNTSEANWLAELTDSGKEAISDALPIYKENPDDVLDFSDGATVFKAWEGLLDSAVGFALPGGAISKVAGMGLKATRAAQMIAKLESVSPTFAKALQSVPAGSMMNYMEGKVMAIQEARDVREQLYAARERGEINLPDEEIEFRAEQAHDNVRIANAMLAPLSMLQMTGLSKGAGYTRNLLKEKGFKNAFTDFGKNIVTPNADNLIVQGLGEAAEEGIQGVISQESSYRALKGTGLEKGDKEFVSRVLDFATNENTILEMGMGFFGGGIQRVMMEGLTGQYTKSAREDYNKRFQEQQSMKETMTKFTEGKLENYANYTAEKNELIKEGRLEEAAYIDDIMAAAVNRQHFETGTTEFAERTLQDIIDGKALPSQEEYLGDEGKQKAQALLDNLREQEQVWLKYADLPLQSELFNNRLQRKASAKTLDAMNARKSNAKSQIIDEINRKIVPTLEATKNGTVFDFNTDALIEQASKEIVEEITEKKSQRRPLNSDYNRLIEGVKSLDIMEDYINSDAIGKQLIETLNSYDKAHKEMFEKKTEQKIIKKKVAKLERLAANRRLKEETTPEEVTKVGKGDQIENKFGEIFTVEGFNKDTKKSVFKDLQGNTIEMTQEEGQEQFKNSAGNYTRRVGKKVVADKAKDAANKKKASQAQPGTPEHKTNKAQNKSSKAQNGEEEAEETEPQSNEGKGTPAQIDTEAQQGKAANPDSLTWSSVNNVDDVLNLNRPTGKEAEDIAEYLENPNNPLIGTRVRITKAPIEGFSNRLMVTLVDSTNTPITHNGTEIFVHVRDNNSEFRQNLDKVLETQSEVYTTINDKAPGFLQWTSDKTNLDIALAKTPEEMEFAIQVNGAFLNGKIDTDGRPDSDETLTSFSDVNQEGQVVVKTKTANGSTFPLRLTINTLSDTDADLIIEMYSLLLDKTTIIEDIAGYPNVTALAKDHPLITSGVLSMKGLTFKDLLRHLVHQGNRDAKFPLYYDKHVLYFGAGESVGSFSREVLNDPIAGDQAKLQLKNWLTSVKTSNVNFRKLQDPKYKKYLVENGVVQTKAKHGANGLIFAQPVISVETKQDTTRPTTTQSTDTKANIERRRQEELSKAFKTGFDIEPISNESLDRELDFSKKNTQKDLQEIESIKQQIINKQTEILNKTGIEEYIEKAKIDKEWVFQKAKDAIDRILNDNGKVPMADIKPFKNIEQLEKDIKEREFFDKKREEKRSKINAKYDAELAALEQTPITTKTTPIQNTALDELSTVDLAVEDPTATVDVEILEEFGIDNDPVKDTVTETVKELISESHEHFSKRAEMISTITSQISNDTMFNKLLSRKTESQKIDTLRRQIESLAQQFLKGC